MEEKGPVRAPLDPIQRLKRWCFRTVRPNVRWKKLPLTNILVFLMALDLGRCEGPSHSSLTQRSALAQALNDNPDLVRYWNPLENYLTRYGYLTPSPIQDISGGNLRTEERLRDSIKIMQKFGNIPQTGHIDRATIELLSRKRCGMPDLVTPAERARRRRRFALQGQKWSHTNLTWSIRDWPPHVDYRMVRREITKAFKVWSDVSKLEFKELDRNPKADIVVSFLRREHNDGYPFDGRGVVLAHAFFPGDDIGGDAHFDAEEPWIYGEPQPGVDGVSLFAVAAHEFGHSLGLSHSSVSGSLMNPFYQIIKDNFQLPRDDTYGIQSLYGAKVEATWEPLSPYNPNTRRPITPATRRPARPPDVPYSTTRPRSRRPTTKSPTRGPSEQPDTCTTTFDAISIIRGQLFIFKDRYFWRFDGNKLIEGYPATIERFWGVDPDMDKIDAVYERTLDTKIVFFSGKQYWLYNGVEKEMGYPRPLTDLGLPPTLKKIDAAMVWGYNGKTYLFSGSKYWRYDESDGRVELDYPRDMAMWRGVPYRIDAAFQHTDRHTYFFKDKRFWQFNDHQMRVNNTKPFNINEYWFDCPSRTEHLPSMADEFSTDHLTDEEVHGIACPVANTQKAVMNLMFVFVIAFRNYSFL